MQVEPMMLANLIIESYNKRGVLREILLEDAQLGEKYQWVLSNRQMNQFVIFAKLQLQKTVDFCFESIFVV